MAKLRKTPSEIKQEQAFRRYKKQRGIKPKGKGKKKKTVNTKFPNTAHLKGKSYFEFLNSDYWKIVRQMVLRRDKNACVICKSTIFLQVHHDTYKNHFKEHLHLEDLMTLCRKCHKEHHYAQL